jgi:hypothetical protein
MKERGSPQHRLSHRILPPHLDHVIALVGVLGRGALEVRLLRARGGFIGRTASGFLRNTGECTCPPYVSGRTKNSCTLMVR